MTLKWFFLIAFTIAHQLVFWFLLLMMVAFCRGGPLSSLGSIVEHILLMMASPMAHLPGVRASASPFFFFIANSFLWSLSAWYALAAWRRLRNLPPIGQRC